MKEIGQRSDHTLGINQLLQAIQRERELTASYLGSEGTQHKQALNIQRQSTDQLADHLREVMDSHSMKASSLAQPPIAWLNYEASRLGLKSVRNKVDQLTLSFYRANSYYSEMIRALLDTADHMMRHAPDLALANLSFAHINFLRGLEQVDQERSVLANAFVRGGFEHGMYALFQTLEVGQKIYFGVFRRTAQQKDIHLFNKITRSPEAAEVARMKERAFASGTATRLYVLLGRLYRHMALRGVYHSFKNLVLRGSRYGHDNNLPNPDLQKRYRAEFYTSYQASQKIIKKILALPPKELPSEQRRLVEIIRENLRAYQANVALVIQQQNAGQSIYRIDQDPNHGVKINDTPAFHAIEKLMNTTAVGAFDVSPNAWLQVSAIKRTKLRALEKRLAHAVKERAEEARHEAFTLLISAMLITLIMVTIISLLGGRLILSLQRRVKRLVTSVDRIANGHLDERYPVQLNDEIGHLGERVNLMAERLDLHHTTSAIIRDLLESALEPTPLQDQLDQSLTLLFFQDNLPIQAKGSIFLVDEESDELVMVSHHGLHPHLLSECARIKPGHCLCGQAAQSREPVLAACLDERHSVHFDDIQPHGHVCLPILYRDKLLGVFNLYLPDGHHCTASELAFYEAIVDTLAGVIVRKRVEEEVERFRGRLLFERTFIEEIVAKMRASSRFDGKDLRTLEAPVERTAGDILLSAYRPSGGHHVMMGDFTGHGLSAAIGGPMVSDIFYAMTAKNFALQEIIDEINQQLVSKTPAGMFMAAVFIELDNGQNQARIWNCSTPDVLLFRDGELHDRVTSGYLARGIIESKESPPTEVSLCPGDRLIACTDGVTETFNRNNEELKQKGVDALLEQIIQHNGPLDELLQGLSKFRQGVEQADDITVVEVRVVDFGIAG
ncbi:MAG: nitrate- and nitrite sensing domain-containing protein [Magnetococcales bacterium]|nr:nitrate- and nitrite sensing domain-containing protein [Magnetococcales bacterium]